MRDSQSAGAAIFEPRAQTFTREGYLGPLRIFSPSECRKIMAYLRRPGNASPLDWNKARAVHERFLFDLAVHHTLMAWISPLIGPDIVLWGVSVVSRAPEQTHPWHSDIESSARDGGFVSVWIGIKNTCRLSALQVIPRSHRLGKTVQESRAERGMARGLATAEAMVRAVRETESEAELLNPDMTDGDALLFDGRLWHGSQNKRRWGRRTALLFQYAAADRPVRIPDFSQLDWPFRFRSAPRPPVILVRGTDRIGINRLVPPPPPIASGSAMIATAIQALELPLAEPAKPWQSFPAFSGPTRTFTRMSCHASVLVPGHSPHPPHAHREEELLIPIHGEVELRIAEKPEDPAPRAERLRPGSFVYYPAWQHHTLFNPSDAPAGYLMFKWSSPPSETVDPLDVTVVHHAELAAPSDAPQFWTRRLFQGPTQILGKLDAHLTILAPGGGYEPHVDSYDVAILTLAGRVETLGQIVEPHSVIYYAAGECHGMRNAGNEPARYLVFEFHAPGVDPSPASSYYRAFPRKALRMGKRLARPIWRRVKRYLPRT